MTRFRLIFALSCFLSFEAPSLAFQSDRLDSLQKVYQDASNPDSIRLVAAKQLTFSLIFSDSDRAKKLLQESMRLAEKDGRTKAYYELYQNLGIYYDVNQQTDSSFLIFSELLEESKRQGWATIQERSLNNLGMNNLNRSLYREAITFFSQALDLSRKNPANTETNWANYLSNLGLANQELGLYDQAIKYHLEALGIRERAADANGVAISSANLGICYKALGEINTAIIFYQKSEEHALKAANLTLYHRVHDNMANLYIGMGQYEKAIENLEIALDNSDGYQSDPKMELSILSNFAAAYAELGQTDVALGYAERGLKVAEQNPDLINYTPTLKKSLAKIYFRKGDFAAANRYLTEYDAVNRAVFNEENAALLTGLQVRYDLEKKENQIALQDAEIQEQNVVLQRNYFAFAALGLLLLFLAATLIYYQNRNKRKQELLVKDRELKVKEAYIHASLESQEQERRRMAQDLHDGFGQYISALRLYVSQLKNENAKKELKTELVSRTDSVLDEMSKEISNVVYDLMPATLIRFGLISALEDLAVRINVGQRAKMEVFSEGIPARMDELVEINLFRICQEWINNVLKYSGAQRIQLHLSEESGTVRLSMMDDGIGFDSSIFLRSKRNGWKNINTRAGLLNAQLELHTQTGVPGTELQVRFPYANRTN